MRHTPTLFLKTHSDNNGKSRILHILHSGIHSCSGRAKKSGRLLAENGLDWSNCGDTSGHLFLVFQRLIYYFTFIRTSALL